ncbi:hypothetical protein Tsubulata_029995, partial [Turnera subulata]
DLYMCSGSKSGVSTLNPIMEGDSYLKKDDIFHRYSVLLELSASDDLGSFKDQVEDGGLDIDEASHWYGRRIGSKKMSFDERTPLMIAAMFGSTDIVKYILGTGKVDVNRACGGDKVTALHCAVAGGASSSVEIVKLLLEASADANCLDASGNKPGDLLASSLNAVDMGTLSPLSLGSSTMPLPTVSTPPMSPLAVGSSSPKSGGMWNKVSLTPPALQLPGSRLKTALCARDLNLELELLGLENHSSQLRQQQLMDELSGLSSPSRWSNDFNRMGDLNSTNLDDVLGSLDTSLLSPLHGSQVQSPTGLHMRQNVNQLRSSYPANLSSSPARKPTSYGFDSSAAVAAAVMNSRSSAFAKRSQSFIDRGAATNRLGLTAAANSVSMMSSNLSNWSSPYGKLDWGMQGDELNKLRKSASFGFRSNNNPATAEMTSPMDEPDVSWVTSLVKDVPSVGNSSFGAERQYSLGKGVRESVPSWMEQLYIEQEQMVA